MAKNRLDLRLQVVADGGWYSSAWRLWITKKGDVYLTQRGMGGVHKYSFHASGICRSAFTREHGTPKTMQDRKSFGWRRASTPPAGARGLARVAWIAFPTDYLSRLDTPPDGTTLIRAAPAGGVTFLEVCYTAESEVSVREAFAMCGRELHSYTPLPNGEAVVVSSYEAEWENQDLKSPGTPASAFPDLLFSANDPDDTGRPVRILMGPPPKDGDCMVLQELGGYPAQLS